ncbi:hypothetical protein AOLI_G00144940 [Acnodon oligacanthus]
MAIMNSEESDLRSGRRGEALRAERLLFSSSSKFRREARVETETGSILELHIAAPLSSLFPVGLAINQNKGSLERQPQKTATTTTLEAGEER